MVHYRTPYYAMGTLNIRSAQPHKKYDDREASPFNAAIVYVSFFTYVYKILPFKIP